MAQALTLKRNVRTKLKPTNREILLPDWDESLHSIWLRKLALNPGFYDDQRVAYVRAM
jgi:hypothetical protein